MDSIILKNVTKTFSVRNSENTGNKKLTALENISFNVPKGQMVGIIGKNGSGKTTLLRTISGIYPSDSGSISVRGKLSPLLQIGTGFHGDLIASENIMIYGLLLGLRKSEIKLKINEIIHFAELDKFTNMKLKNYSLGMRSRLAFSTAMHIDPDILVVDEVLSVGDISFRKKSFDAFISFKKRGKTILFSSHNLDMVSKLCDRVIFLDKGRLIHDGKPKEIIKKYEDYF
ncbi:ABC transporter ATP-binding protein [Nitrosopumilus sp.]|uniref:ABC transporter ATP-binding protein n=1 Tax=Nitrosopumilus sp. TaxID=2024843 RepID=UPI0026344F11|nr:ABC transporter ATP-binding protein [Nitrosopumilus sp.]